MIGVEVRRLGARGAAARPCGAPTSRLRGCGASAARRLQQFEEQFPEAIDLLARALRAGHAFTTGLEMVGERDGGSGGRRVPSDVRPADFRYAGSRTLRQFAERTPLIDAKFFATAVLTQREAGGKLSEVLDNLSSVIRERFHVKRQVRVVTADKRATGWVLCALPPSIATALFILNPRQMMILTPIRWGCR